MTQPAVIDFLVIGAGAAGIFAALRYAELQPTHQVLVLEKSNKLLAKVEISGGGRCNVTNHLSDPEKLSKAYPRGGDFLKQAFSLFTSTDTIRWFEKRGVSIKKEADGRMFPISDNSETIVFSLLNEAKRKRINITTKTTVNQVRKRADGLFEVCTVKGNYLAQKVVLATGGHPQSSGYKWLDQLQLNIVSPCPSLFTFNVPTHFLKELSGVSVPNAEVSIPAFQAVENGPLLITHWGYSGPVILRLSAWQARDLFECGYAFKCIINWLSVEATASLQQQMKQNAKKKVLGYSPFPEIPLRLWQALIEPIVNNPHRSWAEIGQKQLTAFKQQLHAFEVQVSGKTTFKDEFVTCGGIDLSELSPDSFQINQHPGLYAAGEILNIDGITGGFNFQAAWTGGWIAATHAAGN